jgi:hypothetical protein
VQGVSKDCWVFSLRSIVKGPLDLLVKVENPPSLLVCALSSHKGQGSVKVSCKAMATNTK